MREIEKKTPLFRRVFKKSAKNSKLSWHIDPHSHTHSHEIMLDKFSYFIIIALDVSNIENFMYLEGTKKNANT
jgi:hypothetical protein